jgi:hypothetical protein
MKEGDIVMTFVDAVNEVVPMGEAKLVECIEGYGICEMWTVEYLDQPGHLYNVLIKVNNGKS